MAPECKVTFCFTFKPNVFQLWHSASAGMCFVMTLLCSTFRLPALTLLSVCMYMYV